MKTLSLRSKLTLAATAGMTIGALPDLGAKVYVPDITAPKETPPPPTIKREQLRRLKQMGKKK